jgi:hypothetical protein
VSVVVNEFEVVPAQPEEARGPEQTAVQPPGPAVQLEVERAVDARRERDLRLRAD